MSKLSCFKERSAVQTLVAILILLHCIVFALPSWAQATDPAAKAAREHERRLQEDALRRQQQEKEQQKSPDIFLQLPDAESPVEELQNKTCFDIHHIDVQGVMVFEHTQMQALTAPYLNKCLGLAHINQLIKTISNFYIAKGLVTSRAFLQPQNLADGRLDILVVEGKLEKLESSKDTLSERQLRWVFPSNKHGLVNLRDLEQGLEQLTRFSVHQ